MAVSLNSQEGKILRRLIPLETYPKAAFEELCLNISVEQVQEGYLFRRGDTDTALVYLLAGSVTLQAEGLIVEVIDAHSESARFALAHQIPRKIDAVANGTVRIVRLDADLVNNPPPVEYKEDNSYTIIEETDADADDWLNVMLRMPLFQSLPPANLQKLLVAVTTAQFAEGDVIIDTGAPVESFCIISKGQCLRTRPGSAGSIERRMPAGETFGDEYLILGIPSKEKMVALTGVTVIQMAKHLFFEQVIAPLLRQIDNDQARDLVNNNALMLDVRPKQQAEKAPLDSGINIPLMHLNNKISDLDRERKIIVCADEKTSMAAAFLLLKYNFDVYALSDGSILAEPEPEIAAPAVTVPEKALPPLALVEEKGKQVPVAEEIKASPVSKALNPEAELRFLRSENQRLSAHNQHLEEKIRNLNLEKQKLAMRSQLLVLQLKKLKEIMVQYSKK